MKGHSTTGKITKGKTVRKSRKGTRGDAGYYQVVNTDTDEVLLEDPSLTRCKSEARRGYAISGQHHRVTTRATGRFVYSTSTMNGMTHCNPLQNQIRNQLRG
jgi:hypothetical protein